MLNSVLFSKLIFIPYILLLLVHTYRVHTQYYLYNIHGIIRGVGCALLIFDVVCFVDLWCGNWIYWYNVGDTLIVAKSNIGTPTNDLTYTLQMNDFSLTGTKSYWTMECLPTSSLMFSSPNCSGSQFNGLFEQDIEFISVYALTGSVDVEYIIVNAPVATN